LNSVKLLIVYIKQSGFVMMVIKRTLSSTYSYHICYRAVPYCCLDLLLCL